MLSGVEDGSLLVRHISYQRNSCIHSKPALLDSVKVLIPDAGSVNLQSVASVTVKGSTLYVEVFDSDVSIMHLYMS